jgi:hypothetical protein
MLNGFPWYAVTIVEINNFNKNDIKAILNHFVATECDEVCLYKLSNNQHNLSM